MYSSYNLNIPLLKGYWKNQILCICGDSNNASLGGSSRIGVDLNFKVRCFLVLSIYLKQTPSVVVPPFLFPCSINLRYKTDRVKKINCVLVLNKHVCLALSVYCIKLCIIHKVICFID